MIRKVILISALSSLVLAACNGKKEKSGNDKDGMAIESDTTSGKDDILNKTLTDSNGSTLEMTFNNSKGTVEIVFEGEKAELTSQKPASGIWYKNNSYELQGKGEDVELKKDGKVVFIHKGEQTITKSYKSKDGKEMTVNIYNGTNTATIVFADEVIDLKGQRPASGIWYKNDTYELRGKGDALELTKDEKTVFISE